MAVRKDRLENSKNSYTPNQNQSTHTYMHIYRDGASIKILADVIFLY